MLIEKICEYNPVGMTIINDLIHTVLFEAVLALLLPAVGIAVDWIIVRFLRHIIRRIITRPGEFIFSNYVLCLGTIIHELSHAFFALITGAKITEIALFKPDGDSLGHVNFETRGSAPFRALQNSLSACAPVLTGVAICSFMIIKIYPLLAQSWQWILAIYIFISVLFHMNMSPADLKFYFKGIWVLMLFCFPICFVYFIFH